MSLWALLSLGFLDRKPPHLWQSKGGTDTFVSPRVIYYLSIWYTRKELASRIGIFYAALTASSAFGGLLAYGMFQVTPSSGYFRWSYLFFLEGGMTVFWSIISFFVLPVDTQSAWFLNPAEKEVAVLRLEHDSVQSLSTEFSWRESLSEFTTPHGYIRVVLSFVMGVILTSNANFLAMVVRRLGHGVVKTQLVGDFSTTLTLEYKLTQYFSTQLRQL